MTCESRTINQTFLLVEPRQKYIFHKKNAGTLGILTINRIYTLYTGYLLGKSPFNSQGYQHLPMILRSTNQQEKTLKKKCPASFVSLFPRPLRGSVFFQPLVGVSWRFAACSFSGISRLVLQIRHPHTAPAAWQFKTILARCTKSPWCRWRSRSTEGKRYTESTNNKPSRSVP